MRFTQILIAAVFLVQSTTSTLTDDEVRVAFQRCYNVSDNTDILNLQFSLIKTTLYEYTMKVPDVEYEVLAFFPLVVDISSPTETSRQRSQLQQVHTGTIEHINHSSEMQEVQTIEKYIDITETQSITTSSLWEFSTGVSFGAKISATLFGTGVDFTPSVNMGTKYTTGSSTTNTKSETVRVRMPPQTVKCPPQKKTQMTWNIFTYFDTINYLVDLELDESQSLMKVRGKYDPNVKGDLIRQQIRDGTVRWGRNGFTSGRFDIFVDCIPLKFLHYPNVNPRNNEMTISKVNGKILLKNVSMEVKIDGNLGQFNTQESNI